MSGKGISKLPMPPSQFRPDLIADIGKFSLNFPSRREQEAEDLTRAKLLRLYAGKYSYLDDAEQASDLADDLEDATQTGIIYRSPASAVWIRDVQLRVAGGLWKLADQVGLEDRAFTIMPQCWDIPVDQLRYFDARSWQVALRGLLRSYGGADANGYLFAGLHGEYVKTTNKFRLHVHGIAYGEMIDVVDELRHSPKMRGYPKPAKGQVKAKRKTAVRINRLPMTNRPKYYTYTLQSYWPSRVYEDPKTGEEIRGRRGRIPDPHHTAYLLWLDRWRVEDLSLLMGLRVTDDGFKMNQPI